MFGVAKLVAKFVVHRRLRSLLTTLGIAIGVALVFSLININEGFVQSVTDMVSNLGNNFAMVLPKQASFVGRSAYFTRREVDEVEKLSYVKLAVGGYGTILPVKIRNKNLFLSVRAGEPKKLESFFNEIQAYDFEKGRAIKNDERGAVVIGYSLADKYGLSPGNQIEVAGKRFRIVGVMKKIGNKQMDDIVTMNIEDVWDITGDYNKYLIIFVKMTEVNEDGLKRAVKRVRGRDDFEVSTPQKIADRLTQFFKIISIFFISVAAISILVGSVGVANTMYASVMERTKDIGIMKSVGANQGDIAFLFMLESGLLSLFGGVFGIVVGLAITWGFSYYVNLTGIMSSFGYPLNAVLILETLLGAFLVGILAGLFPALYASRLEPVQALRREV